MTKKELIRMIAFGLVVCLMLGFLCDLFENENHKNYDQRIYTYRTFDKGTVDAVYIGTSGVDRYWIAAKAYEDYGMTVYPLSTDGMPSWLYVDMLEYALTYQDPELILLDVRAFCQNNVMEGFRPKTMDIKAHRVLNAIPWLSPLWFKVAFKTMKLIHSVDETQPRFNLSLLLSFVRFHQAWQDAGLSIFERNLGSRLHEFCGYYMHPSTTTLKTPMEYFMFDDTVQDKMDGLSDAAFYETIKYAREKGIKILFVDSPQIAEPHEMLRANYIYEKLDEMGIDYVTYYQSGEEGPFTLDLDLEKDFYNPSHVNYFGAVKFTDALAAYLDENYDLPDRRNDPAAQKYWDGVYAKIEETVQYYIDNDTANPSSVVIDEEDE